MAVAVAIIGLSVWGEISSFSLAGKPPAILTENHAEGGIQLTPSMPQVMSPAEVAAIKVPRGIHLAQLPWQHGHDLYHPISEDIHLAQPWQEPILEEQRHQRQLQVGGAVSTRAVQILANFSDAVPVKVREISPTHYAITFAGPMIQLFGKCQNWFLFRAMGVKGKTVRFDLTNVNIKWWQTLNPVYSYCDSLSRLRNFESKPVINPQPTQAFVSSILPDTTGQRWHYIANTWQEGDELCFVMKFTGNNAYIAMRYTDFVISWRGKRKNQAYFELLGRP